MKLNLPPSSPPPPPRLDLQRILKSTLVESINQGNRYACKHDGNPIHYQRMVWLKSYWPLLRTCDDDGHHHIITDYRDSDDSHNPQPRLTTNVLRA